MKEVALRQVHNNYATSAQATIPQDELWVRGGWHTQTGGEVSN